MKGDFTRNTFDPGKQYTGVRMQQGRVQLDADWNEQLDIANHRDRLARIDELGRCGTPEADPGFEISGGSGLQIGQGHYYADGILCQNEGPKPIGNQPLLPGFDPSNVETPGRYLVYLDVWEQLRTAVEDPDIREKALGGPDTATRTRVVWQVRLISLEGETLDYADLREQDRLIELIEARKGALTVALDADAASEDPCLARSDSAYRGLENQLYRVEIHRGNEGGGTPTFKWSRDNGSIVTSLVERIDDHTIKVADTGPDQVRGFTSGVWVELTDDDRELRGEHGAMAWVVQPDLSEKTLELTDLSEPLLAMNFGANPKVRRWDTRDTTTGTRRINDIDHYLDGRSWIKIEKGVIVRFERGSSDQYRAGDFWTIPARTIDGSIEWTPGAQAPHGISHSYASLAVVVRAPDKTWKLEHDCRRRFPADTEHRQLLYVGGDGQEGLPDRNLAMPLRVRVMNGQFPVRDALVEFELTGRWLNGHLLDEHRGGWIWAFGPATEGVTRWPGSGHAYRVVLQTNESGLATCQWHLGPELRVQRVRATLLDDDGHRTTQAIRFAANLSIASAVAYDTAGCPLWDPEEVETVQDALDALCRNWTLSYHSGDGQIGEPGKPLAAPLRVQVSNGSWLVSNARVRFSIVDMVDPEGIIHTATTGGSLAGHTSIDLPVDDQGIAEVTWTMGTDPGVGKPGVRAVLLNGEEDPTKSVIFSADLLSCRQLLYVSGDGQEGLPDRNLAMPLRVRVMNCGRPVKDALVEFELTGRFLKGRFLEPDPHSLHDDVPGGWIWADGPTTEGVTPWPHRGHAYRVVLRTNGSGLATCQWHLGPELRVQRVRATLLDDDGHRTAQAIHFAANLSIASAVAYRGADCAVWRGEEVETVQDGLDVLCRNLARLAASVSPVPFVKGVKVRRNGGVSDHAIEIGASEPLLWGATILEGFRFELTAPQIGLSREDDGRWRHGLRIAIELPFNNLGYRSIILDGKISGEDAFIDWIWDPRSLEAILPMIADADTKRRVIHMTLNPQVFTASFEAYKPFDFSFWLTRS